MNRPLRNETALVRVASSDVQRLPGSPKKPNEQGTQQAAKSFVMRRYCVASLQSDGMVKTTHHVAPASPAFEAAFSAFARGALVLTDKGNVAVEDLLPGDRIITEEFGPSKLLWIGSMTMLPASQDATQDPDVRTNKLARITADTFGISRPMPDFLAGPSARLLHRPIALRDISGQGPVLTPASDFVDGSNVIEISPQSAVTVFHLALAHHATITVAGLEVETFHPGNNLGNGMGRNTLALYLSLFPHIETLSDFGPLAHPRATLETLNKLSAA